jgi:hypothetical protein
MKKGSAALIGLILVLAVLSNAYADYTYKSLDVPGASYFTMAFGISNTGTIVGIYDSSGFILNNGIYNSINYQGASDTYVQGINNAGTIVGTFFNSTGAYGYSSSGGINTVLNSYYAYGINDAGTIVGSANGMSGFSLTNGTYTILNHDGATVTYAYGINNGGTIVGGYSINGVGYGFSFSNGAYSSLTYPNASGTSAMGINDSGTTVGMYSNKSGQEFGFIWNNGTFITLTYPGAKNTVIDGINDAGTIVGWYQDAQGTHGFEATPTPIPGAVFLCGPGLLGLAAIRRRFKK